MAGTNRGTVRRAATAVAITAVVVVGCSTDNQDDAGDTTAPDTPRATSPIDFDLPAGQPVAWSCAVADGVFDIVARDKCTRAQLGAWPRDLAAKGAKGLEYRWAPTVCLS